MKVEEELRIFVEEVCACVQNPTREPYVSLATRMEFSLKCAPILEVEGVKIVGWTKADLEALKNEVNVRLQRI